MEIPSRQRIIAGSACAVMLGVIGYFGKGRLHTGNSASHPKNTTARSIKAVPETPSGPVKINLATASDLENISGIGPSLASKIVEYRDEHGPFTSVDDLDKVPGIGKKLLEKIRPKVTLE